MRDISCASAPRREASRLKPFQSHLCVHRLEFSRTNELVLKNSEATGLVKPGLHRTPALETAEAAIMLQADRKRRWAIFPWMCALSALSTVAFAQVPEDARDWIALAIERVCDDPSKDGLAVQNALPGSWLLEDTRQPPTGPPGRILMRFALPEGHELTLQSRLANGTLRQFRASVTMQNGQGLETGSGATLSGDCRWQLHCALCTRNPERQPPLEVSRSVGWRPENAAMDGNASGPLAARRGCRRGAHRPGGFRSRL